MEFANPAERDGAIVGVFATSQTESFRPGCKGAVRVHCRMGPADLHTSSGGVGLISSDVVDSSRLVYLSDFEGVTDR